MCWRLNKKCPTWKEQLGTGAVEVYYLIMTSLKLVFAFRLSLDTLQADVNALKKKLTSVGWSLQESAEDLKEQMTGFIEVKNLCILVCTSCSP